MYKYVAPLIIMACFLIQPANSIGLNNEDISKREKIEWTDTWVSFTNKKVKPRVLMIGDSITRDYYRDVDKIIKHYGHSARFTTSLCVADPRFLIQLGAFLDLYDFSIIHFNNGLHGFEYSKNDYLDGYENALALIKEREPTARIILALTTPLQSTSIRNNLNTTVDQRNEITRELAKKYELQINDLHIISKEHPEHYRDPFHFKRPAIKIQSQQVGDVINKLLLSTE